CLEVPDRAKRDSGRGLRERWRVQARELPGEQVVFEGAPLFCGGHVYAAVSRLGEGRIRTALVCHDADTGALRWRQAVCEVVETPARILQPRPPLLTLAGPTLAWCSHSGAVVAVDALSGKRLWGVRYPSRDRQAADEPAPCVYAGGRLFAAPQD